MYKSRYSSLLAIIAIACCGSAMAGCSSLKEDAFSNRIVTTVACDEVMVISNYGPFAISSKIDPKDIGEMPCKNPMPMSVRHAISSP